MDLSNQHEGSNWMTGLVERIDTAGLGSVTGSATRSDHNDAVLQFPYRARSSRHFDLWPG